MPGPFGTGDYRSQRGDAVLARWPAGGVGPFDAVVSVVVLHHIGLAAGLGRMAELLRPGGRLAVVGMASSRSPLDLAYDLAATVGTRVHRLTKTYWETSAPKVWPLPHSYGHERREARRVPPGVRYRRLLLWCYALVWNMLT